MISLPPCSHRGEQLGEDRWPCTAPSLVVPGGVVSADVCCRLCPLVKRPAQPPTGDDAQPLVSCLMPTGNRSEFAALAIRRFLAQDYVHSELVIIDDGTAPLAPGLVAHPRIRYVRLKQSLSIGAKRNLACREAPGSILVQWDDDDWHGPERIRRQIAPLLAGQSEITGLSQTLFLDLARLEFWQPSAESFRRIAFAGVHCGTLAFRREVGERTCYPDFSQGEDVAFLRPALAAGCRVAAVPARSDFVYVRHGTNVSQIDDFFRRFGARRIPAPPALEVDLPHYRALQAQGARAAHRGVWPTADPRQPLVARKALPPGKFAPPAKVAPPRTIRNLAAITAHFNPCGFRRPRENYDRFAAGIAAAGVPLWTVELAYDRDPFSLPAGERMLQVRGDRRRNLLWQKERLLNLLIERLPADIDAIAWIDADVLLLNPQWAAETKAVLGTRCVAQLFAESYDLLPDGRLEPLKNSAGWALAERPAGALDFSQSHPGFAWAARADVLRAHGLYDSMVTGSGDSMMVAGFAAQELPMYWRLNAAWQTHHGQWKRAVAGLTGGSTGYVRGSLLHLWHGRRENRRYNERLTFLTGHEFDPRTDLQLDAGGLWSWTDHALKSKPAMVELVRGYFDARREDE
jgi:hypothetical protein